MQSLALVLLFGVFLCGVHGAADQSPDLLSMVTKLQSQVQTLETAVAQQQKAQRIAFFAGFHLSNEQGNHGPFTTDTTIKYQQVMANEGNGYNAVTGAFTAPVRGLYVFHFTIFGSYDPTPNTVASLMKNSVKLASVLDQAAADTHDSCTRVAVVTLEAGDAVYVELQAKSYFYDYYGVLNSFSGFLLAPM